MILVKKKKKCYNESVKEIVRRWNNEKTRQTIDPCIAIGIVAFAIFKSLLQLLLVFVLFFIAYYLYQGMKQESHERKGS